MRAFDLARRQVAIDRALTRRFPSLFERKKARLLASPHGFLRGSAPLFYELLAAHPDLGEGPEGVGFVVGDMHIENLGAYKSDDQKIVFDLNDFDDAAIAPRRFDVLRLATSVILSGRSFAKNAQNCLHLAEALLEAYVNAAFDVGPSAPPMTPGMLAIVEKAARRSKKDLLDARAIGTKGHRMFVRGERYLDLSPELAAIATRALPRYVEALGDRAPKGARQWMVEDAAQRIAGTGSLGRIRIALLVQNEDNEERILDFKEAAPASCAPGEDALAHGPRVVDGARALLENPPKLLAPIALPELGLSMIGRQLTPQEDKLDLARIPNAAEELDEIAARVGHILGSAHKHAGWAGPKPSPWTAAEQTAMIDRALELAGIHESIYLAYARAAST